jgi:hypothetical protein
MPRLWSQSLIDAGAEDTRLARRWFGPRARFHGTLDTAALHVLLRVRARSNPPCPFFVQDEDKGLPILRKARMAIVIER